MPPPPEKMQLTSIYTNVIRVKIILSHLFHLSLHLSGRDVVVITKSAGNVKFHFGTVSFYATRYVSTNICRNKI